MASKQSVGRRFTETPPNIPDAERAALVAYTREAIDREHDSTGPGPLARVRRLKRLLARLNRESEEPPTGR
jgi:hypothetical protein